MVMTDSSSTASPRDSLKFELQSFLFRSSRLMAKILKQIRLSTSQVVSHFLDFTERKRVFIAQTVSLNFKGPVPWIAKSQSTGNAELAFGRLLSNP